MIVKMSQKEFDILSDAHRLETEILRGKEGDTIPVSDKGLYLRFRHSDMYIPIIIDNNEPTGK